MKINRIIRQHRRDFTAEYICEHCGYTHERSGYDDDYFHTAVIPGMKCPQCGKTASDDYRPLTPKYAKHEQI
jgi:predicted RNA-binding Zn-ribbon protein involved in translation (DUF1610 family)